MTQWFFGLSENASAWFTDMLKVAVNSARLNTQLEPHCLYYGNPSGLTNWLTDQGVQVHEASVPFKEELFDPKVIAANAGSEYKPAHACGHFLRILVPDYATEQYALYTDCDVMFERQPSLPECAKAFAAAGEFDMKTWKLHRGGFNSGVMLINVAAFRQERASFIEYVRSNNFFHKATNSYDQSLLNEFFRGRWDILEPEQNWRPMAGINNAAEIVHFHGPKPRLATAVLTGADTGESFLGNIVLQHRAAYEHYLPRFNGYLEHLR